MPIFSILLLIFILGNIGMPGTVNFIGEFMVLMGVFIKNSFVGIISAVSMVLGAIYSIWLYNRLVFGLVKNKTMLIFCDISRREFHILIPLAFFSLLLGIYPSLILNGLSLSLNNYIY